jgi:hypothetical protein
MAEKSQIWGRKSHVAKLELYIYEKSIGETSNHHQPLALDTF